MTTQTVEIKLKPGEAEKLRAAHHKGDTASAVRAAINESLERAHLRAQYPRPHVPNAATARALRSKERGVVLSSRADVEKFVASIPARK